MTAREAYARIVRELTLAGVASPQAEAWHMLEALLELPRIDIHTTDPELSLEQQRRLGEWLGRRKLREPLQLILRRAHFYGLELEVAPGVLIPRPETERLVELVLERIQGRETPRVVDIGTGTGAIALAISAVRRDARVTASDNSATALRVARENARRLELEVELIESDLFRHPQLAARVSEADVLVSNPPYLPDTDRDRLEREVGWDPAQALFSGPDGLDVFRRLISGAHALMREGAALLVELDPRNVHQSAEMAGSWPEVRVIADLAGRDRFLDLTR